MTHLSIRILPLPLLLTLGVSPLHAQFSSGSNGADGPLDPLLPPTQGVGTVMVTDSSRNRVVLFGGLDDPYGDTWEFDGTTWTYVTTANIEGSPWSRHGHQLAYDSARERVVLFGGYNLGGTVMNDTWEYDGIQWTEIQPADSPSPRFGHGMVYDPGRGRVVLFGGLEATDEVTWSFQNDTWEYDGTNWIEVPVSDPPPGLAWHSMSYLPNSQRTLLFGGESGESSNRTFEYSGGQWLEVFPANSPSPRNRHGMAYDPGRNRVVLFGGTFDTAELTEDSVIFGDTWEYHEGNWVELPPTDDAPKPRHSHAMAFDPTTERILLHGGDTGEASHATHTFDGSTWRLLGDNPYVIDMRARPDGIWNFTSINIPAGMTVKFRRNESNAPVVWLASGGVSINGIIDLSGADAHEGPAPMAAEPGPGGFGGGPGGRPHEFGGRYEGRGGMGPGGGQPGVEPGQAGGGGGHAVPGVGDRGGASYGNQTVRTLAGGSGGGGGGSSDSSEGGNGGAGGGAILIASSQYINLDGAILSRGGNGAGDQGPGGGGSGGAIRLAANSVTGSGGLDTAGGRDGLGQESGSHGYVRIEGYFIGETFNTTGRFTARPPVDLGLHAPGSIVITEVAGANVVQPPAGNLMEPDVTFSAEGEIMIRLSTEGIPVGTGVMIQISGLGETILLEAPVAVDGSVSAGATVPAGVGLIQAWAEF